MPSRSSPVPASVVAAAWPLAVGGIYYLLAAFALFCTRGNDGIATMWPPSGLLLATLLAVPRVQAPRFLAAAALASLLANLSAGVPAALAAGFTVANIVEPVVALAALHRCGVGRIAFTSAAGVGNFCLASTLAAAASAALATGMVQPPTLQFALSWFSTDLLGMLIIGPIIIIGVSLYRKRGTSPGPPRQVEAVVVMTSIGALSALVFAQSAYPLLFLPMAGVLVAVFRLGPFGAAASTLVVAVAGSVSVFFGYGPTALIDDGATRLFFLQFYLVVLLGAALSVAALLATRDRLLAALVASNDLLDEARRAAELSASRATSIAETDQLTGLPNRRRAIQVLEALAGLSDAQPASVAIFDIDHFKRINDSYGHLVGDSVLQRVARDAAGALRAGDFIGRFGGEEFILVLPQTPVSHALAAAERVRAAVAAGGTQESGQPQVTVSIGLAACRTGETVESMLKRADDALYQAKDSGRNAFRLAA